MELELMLDSNLELTRDIEAYTFLVDYSHHRNSISSIDEHSFELRLQSIRVWNFAYANLL